MRMDQLSVVSWQNVGLDQRASDARSYPFGVPRGPSTPLSGYFWPLYPPSLSPFSFFMDRMIIDRSTIYDDILSFLGECNASLSDRKD